MPNGVVPKDAFEGYVVGKLEAIAQRLDALPCVDTSKRLGKVEQEVANIKGKATVYGAITGFVSGIVAKFIFWR